jgi:hypothetical protein
VPMLSGAGGTERLFTIRTSGGGVHYAKSVVLAVGAGNAPCIPAPFEGIGMGHEAACHALSLRGDCGLPKVLKDKVGAGKRTNVLVVGGGLTSAQIGDMVIRQGIAKVWHLTRGSLKGMCGLIDGRFGRLFADNLDSQAIRHRLELDEQVQEPRESCFLDGRR